jgi:D-lactate dehydrogenase
VLQRLAAQGVQLVLLRCAGFNNVDLAAAAQHGMQVARVPAYSPQAVAEHTLALIMTLNRQIHRAYNRVREGNFMLDGLLGFTMQGKIAGIVGTGKIGLATARILQGFGCSVLAYDPFPSSALDGMGDYVALDQLLERADIVSLHCPLSPQTHHLIDHAAIRKMKPGAMLVNTSRGALIDTAAVIAALKSHHLGALAIDVYEQESELFFRDHSSEIIDDDVFQRLMTFPNVLVTGHQGFFTAEALSQIATVTLGNLQCHVQGRSNPNRVEAS